ncbi:MAG TPA: deoxyribonuclease V [Chloroflexota bacterium]|nr:deoxyribonuclease V [Chloroflexota bacterium]
MRKHWPEAPSDVDPADAIRLQGELARRIDCTNRLRDVRFVAGVDISFPRGEVLSPQAQSHTIGRPGRRSLTPATPEARKKTDPHRSQLPEIARAAAVLLRYDDLRVVEIRIAQAPVRFPYIPGLLSFREAEAALAALRQLSITPDVVVVDGHGRAHPRRLGIASHLGLLSGLPTIGCAKSRLTGRALDPDDIRGSWTPLIANGEVIGAVVRTKPRTKPVYVSIGNQVDLPKAIEVVLACDRGYRLPEPTRQAHLAAARGVEFIGHDEVSST